MENIAVNMASDLSRSVREAIEDMLGRALRDDEQVSVMAFARTTLQPESAGPRAPFA
jgi:hypothetical protein